MTALPSIAVRQTRWAVLALWGASLVLLLLAIGTPAVTRTQEARVLETARQMLDRPWAQWIIPRLNGTVRLQKPPLCYWLTAQAYWLFGISESVGRIPDALCGWLTLALVYRIGREQFNPETGLLGAALLLSSYGFFRFTRLAETDGPSSMMVTLAVYALLRGDRGSAVWLHVAAIAMAGAALAKGGPAIYPLLFLILYSIIERRRKLLERLFSSGAFVTALLLGLPWFVYVLHTLGHEVFATEVDNLTAGRNHGAWPWIYIPMAIEACAPWSGFAGFALVGAIVRWKADRGLRIITLWLGSIALPLSLIGNKQPHYLLPMLPPLMLMTARTLVTRWSTPSAWKRGLEIVTLSIAPLGYAAIVAMALFSMDQRGHHSGVDYWAMSGVFVTSSMILAARYRFGLPQAIVVAVGLYCLLMPLCVGSWLGGVVRYTPRSVAVQMRERFDNQDFLFFGPNASLPLCFYLRQEIHRVESVDALSVRSQSGTIVIAITKPNGVPPEIPPRFEPVLTLSGGEQKVCCYRDGGEN